MKRDLPNAGDELTVRYPFVRCTYTEWDSEGPGECQSWRPGTEFVDVGEGDVEAHAHGIGGMVLTVVGIYQPPKYLTRIFYTRKFIRPDGRAFGKGKLHIATLEKCSRLARGYQHDYVLKSEPSAPTQEQA